MLAQAAQRDALPSSVQRARINEATLLVTRHSSLLRVQIEEQCTNCRNCQHRVVRLALNCSLLARSVFEHFHSH